MVGVQIGRVSQPTVLVAPYFFALPPNAPRVTHTQWLLRINMSQQNPGSHHVLNFGMHPTRLKTHN